MLLRWTSHVEIVTRAALDSPLPVGETRLARALAWSAIVHAALVVAIIVLARPSDHTAPEVVDIEIAPPPPPVEALPAEVAKPIEQGKDAEHAAAAATQPPEETNEPALAVDAGVDAAPPPPPPPDAAPRVAAHRDAAILDAAGSDDLVAMTDIGSGVGSADAGSATGSADVGSAAGVAGATEVGSGSGSAGMDDQPAVAGAQTSPGTAANLLAYMPPGHVLAVLVRFDRLRGTEWAKRTEALFQAMPDYGGLFGDHDADIADKIDLLAISTPQPRSVIATTLVMHTQLARPAIRDLLGPSIAWTTARGGMLGTRGAASGFPGDRRLLLAPWRGWYVLAQPEDLGNLSAKRAGGRLDTVEATGTLPAWLQQIRSIATESGDDAAPGSTGPALVLTLGGAPLGTGPARTGRYKLPDVGLGVTSLPVPQRLSLAMQLVTQGWLVRGNIVFSTEAEADELATALTQIQHRLLDSRILSSLLAKQHVLDVIKNLSLARTGARVSYATSISIADARAVLTATRDALH